MKRVCYFVLLVLMLVSMLSVFSYAEATDIQLYKEEPDKRGATPIDDADYGIRFTVPEGKEMVAFRYVDMPAWGAPDKPTTSNFNFALYAWDTDYATTTSKQPLFTQQITGHKDNETVAFSFSDAFPAGTYLALATGGASDDGGHFGVWSYPAAADDDIETFTNGQSANFDGCSTITVQPASAPSTGDFGVVTMAVAAVTALTGMKRKKVA